MITRMVGLLGLALFTFHAQSAPRTADPTPEQSQQIQKHNEQNSLLFEKVKPLTLDRPFSDLEDAGYLFFSAETEFDSDVAKREMARNLPAGVTLVLYAESGVNKDAIRAQYRGLIEDSRLKVVTIPNTTDGFWSRDGLPVPIWNQSKQMEMVDARYYHGFEPDSMVAGWFQSNLMKHNYYYEGGNFMVTDDGTCITVDNTRSKSIPLNVFKNYYGCNKTIRLPFEKGIGHVDESVRVAGTRKVFTDSQQYAQILQSEGFQVIMLPRPNREYETYVNSLLVNGTMFVPIFGQSNDAAAIRAYEQAGFKVVPIKTVSLANNGHGSIHCITMTYPNVPFRNLLSALGAKEL